MPKRILAINPGSTSTKIAVYEDETPIYTHSFSHSPEDLRGFKDINEQYSWRRDMILDELEKQGIGIESLDAVVGRGGLLRPVESGVFAVNDAMLYDLRNAERKHASNLGGMIARYIGDKAGIPSYITDPVVVDEMIPYARISGLPELPRKSILHALNQKAVARRYAKEKGTQYEDLNLVVCHMGGGITVSAHRAGKIIDTTNGFNGDGPFTPERAGTLPTGDLVDLCYSGKYTHAEMQKLIHGKGGLVAHLGTTSIPEILDRVDKGDLHAMLIIRAMVYSVAKEIGAMATALCGHVDAILITGGIAHSKRITDYLAGHCSFIAPILVYPGEDELLSLAQNTLRVLRGELEAKVYESELPDDPAHINDTTIPSRLREWLANARFSNFSSRERFTAMRQYLRSWRRPWRSHDD